MNDNIRVLLSAEQIARRVEELGRAIAKDYQGKEDIVLIPVLKGSMLFAADLMRALADVMLSVEFLACRSYGEGTESSGVVQITYDLTKSIEGKHVILVEDIVDTGLTMKYLLENLGTRKPKSLRVCSLLHKPARARVEIPIDYLGFTIEDLFVIGYGLDYAEKYRNLPYIGVLTPS